MTDLWIRVVPGEVGGSRLFFFRTGRIKSLMNDGWSKYGLR